MAKMIEVFFEVQELLPVTYNNIVNSSWHETWSLKC